MINNKGLSEMIGYVLLIVIAVALSGFVYSYLSAYTPKDQSTCKEGTSLIIQDSWCNSTTKLVNLTLINKGLFKVDAAYIRFGAANRTVKDLLNLNDLYLTRFIGSSDTGLKPGNTISKQYTVPQSSNPGQYGLEIEPAVFDNNVLTPCSSSVINQPIICSP